MSSSRTASLSTGTTSYSSPTSSCATFLQVLRHLGSTSNSEFSLFHPFHIPPRLRRTRRTFSTVALLIAYGLEPQGEEDKYVGMLRELNAIGADLCVPGKYVVESLPVLQYLPSWLPGAGFKREIASMKSRMRQITTELWQAGKAHLVSSPLELAVPSLTP